MKEEILLILESIKNGGKNIDEAYDELQFLYNNTDLSLGEDSDGENIKPNDIVLRDVEFEEIIKFGRYKDLYGCGHIIGYYVPNNCKVITYENNNNNSNKER